MNNKSFRWAKPHWCYWRRRINKFEYLDDMGCNITEDAIYKFLKDLIEEYAKKLNIQFSEFQLIFMEKKQSSV